MHYIDKSPETEFLPKQVAKDEHFNFLTGSNCISIVSAKAEDSSAQRKCMIVLCILCSTNKVLFKPKTQTPRLSQSMTMHTNALLMYMTLGGTDRLIIGSRWPVNVIIGHQNGHSSNSLQQSEQPQLIYVKGVMISAKHHQLTLKVLVTTTDAQWEGMGDVGSARYEPALLPPCSTIRVLSYVVTSKFS